MIARSEASFDVLKPIRKPIADAVKAFGLRWTPTKLLTSFAATAAGLLILVNLIRVNDAWFDDFKRVSGLIDAAEKATFVAFVTGGAGLVDL